MRQPILAITLPWRADANPGWRPRRFTARCGDAIDGEATRGLVEARLAVSVYRDSVVVRCQPAGVAEIIHPMMTRAITTALIHISALWGPAVPWDAPPSSPFTHELVAALAAPYFNGAAGLESAYPQMAAEASKWYCELLSTGHITYGRAMRAAAMLMASSWVPERPRWLCHAAAVTLAEVLELKKPQQHQTNEDFALVGKMLGREWDTLTSTVSVYFTEGGSALLLDAKKTKSEIEARDGKPRPRATEQSAGPCGKRKAETLEVGAIPVMYNTAESLPMCSEPAGLCGDGRDTVPTGVQPLEDGLEAGANGEAIADVAAYNMAVAIAENVAPFDAGAAVGAPSHSQVLAGLEWGLEDIFAINDSGALYLADDEGPPLVPVQATPPVRVAGARSPDAFAGVSGLPQI